MICQSKTIKRTALSFIVVFTVLTLGRVAVAAEFFDKSKGIAGYMDAIFKFSLGAAIFLAVAALVFGGITYMISYGKPEVVNDAKEIIIAAISGLVVILISVMLLNVLDPRLTTLTNPAAMELDTTPEGGGIGTKCKNDEDCDSYNCDKITGKCIKGKIPKGKNCTNKDQCEEGLICDGGFFGDMDRCCYKDKCEGDYCCVVLEENPGYGDDFRTFYSCKNDKCCIDNGKDCNTAKDTTCCSGDCDGLGDKGSCKQ